MSTIETSQADFLAALLSLSDKILKDDSNITDEVTFLNGTTAEDTARKNSVIDTLQSFIFNDSNTHKEVLQAVVNSLDCLAEGRDSYLALIEGYSLEVSDEKRVGDFVSQIISDAKVYNFQLYNLVVRYTIILHDPALIEQALNKIQGLGSGGGEQ